MVDGYKRDNLKNYKKSVSGEWKGKKFDMSKYLFLDSTDYFRNVEASIKLFLL